MGRSSMRSRTTGGEDGRAEAREMGEEWEEQTATVAKEVEEGLAAVVEMEVTAVPGGETGVATNVLAAP